MMPLLTDTTLSTALFDVVRAILPYTAPGNPMPPEKAHQAVTHLATAMKLASLMEQELAVHRHGGTNIMARVTLENMATTALDQLVRGREGKVVKVDFEGGRKK